MKRKVRSEGVKSAQKQLDVLMEMVVFNSETLCKGNGKNLYSNNAGVKAFTIFACF